jgi:hypothetical protein
VPKHSASLVESQSYMDVFIPKAILGSRRPLVNRLFHIVKGNSLRTTRSSASGLYSAARSQ